MKTDALEVINPTPAELLHLALSKGTDIAQLTQLMDLKERWDAAEAKKAYDDAKAKFSAFAIQVTRDKTNNQYGSKYTSLGNLVNIVTPFLAKCDLNARWELDQSSGIKITCVLSHVAGHSERVSLVVPPDSSGAKNPIQQIKSAITYGKVCTFESVCGLASSDGNLDDDANGAYSNGDLSEQLEYIANACTQDELKKLYTAAYKMFDGNQAALRQIVAAKDARKKEL